MQSPSRDVGYERWFMYIPGQALRAIPPAVLPESRVEYARGFGATVVRRGDQIIWRATDQASGRSKGHLAVVR